MGLKTLLGTFTRGWRKRRPIARHAPTRHTTRLLVEMLERRDLLAAPTIVAAGVLPLDGSTVASGSPTIRVQFSESMTSSVLNASNYVLLGSTGNNITINQVNLDNSIVGAPVQSVVNLTYNGGAPLVVDNYTLFVRGDRLIDQDEGLAMAQPGQLIVANGGSNKVSVVAMPGDGTLGAMSNYNLAAVGTQAANPNAVGLADLDGDGINDLVVVNAGTNQVLVYQGQLAADGGGYDSVPAVTLNLPAGTANLGKSLLLSDLTKDGKRDLIVANVNTNNVTVYLNTSASAGTMSFSAGTNFTTDAAPVGIVAADFDGDTNVDLAVAISTAPTDLDGGVADYRVNVLPGDGAGGFGTLANFKVGDVTPTGLTAPSSIGAGLLDQDNKVDLAVGGSNGFGLLINNSTPGAIAFNFQAGVFGAASVVSLAVASLDAGGSADVAVATTAGNIEFYRNTNANGPVAFLAPTTTAVAAGTAGRLAVGDLNNDGRSDLVVTNANAAGRVTVLQNNNAGGSISAATNTNPVRVISTGHGLITGQRIVVSGATGNTAINNGGPNPTWTVTVVTGVIAAANGAGGGAPININALNHGLQDGDRITIAGNAFAAANGTFTITRVDSDNFTLNNTTAMGTGAGGTWTSLDRFILNGVNGNGAYTGGATWVRAGDLTSNIADASNTGPIVITSRNHGLTTGWQVTITGVTGNTNANNTWTITVVDADRFSLNTSTGNGAYTGGGTWTVASNITGATSGSPIVITSTNHGLTSGQTVVISGVLGNTNANGTRTITRIDADTFSLNGTTGGPGAYSGGGLWLVTGSISNTTGAGTDPIVVTSNNHGLTTGQIVNVAGASDANANGTHTITVLTANTFSLNNTTGANPAGSGGTWTLVTTVPVVSNTSPIIVTSNGHGLTTGMSVTVAGVTGTTAANGAWTITVIDQDHFILNGSAGNGEYVSGGTWTTNPSFAPALGAMTASGLGGASPIAITTAIPHGLVNGNQVTFGGVSGSLGSVLNGKTFVVTSVDANHFTLNGTTAAGAGVGGAYVTGAGAMGPPASPYNVDATPIGVAIGDTNQDGAVDVVTANNTGNDVSLLLGNGTGGLSVPANLNIGPTVLSGVAIADLNADGIPDIVVFNNNGSTNNTQVSILQGQGGGTYAAPVNIQAAVAGHTFNSLSSLAIADVNGDGRPDLVYAAAGTDEVGFAQNMITTPGTPIVAGSFVARDEVSVGRSPTQVVMGDFNNDGKLDMAVSHNNSGGGFGARRGVTVRLGNGDFTFQNSTEYDDGTPMSAVVLGDFNKDGNLDFIAAEDNAPGNIWVHYGNGKGAFTANGGSRRGNSFATSVPNPGAIRAADFNGDGFLDVIVSSKSTNLTNAGVAVLLNQLGTGFGAALQTDVIPGTGVQDVLTTDVNQDGFTDAIVATRLQTVAGTVTNASGNGVSPIVLTVNSTNGLSVGDTVQVTGVNGNTAANGTWLITAISGGKGGPRITLGNLSGAGAPTGNGNYSGGGTWTKIFSGVTTTDNLYVLIGNGNGTFETPVPYLAGNPGLPLLAPSYLASTPAPLVRVTTFASGGTVVNTNLIVNGDFEARDLNGEQGNLFGWQTFDLNASPGGSQGGWNPQTGTTSPMSGNTVPAPTGKYRAMLDQHDQIPYTGNTNPNTAASYEGSHALYQDVTIPANVTRVLLSLSLYIDNTDAGAYTDTSIQTSLDYRTSNPSANQQVRIDIMRPTAPILSVNANPSSTGNVASAAGAGGSPIEITTSSANTLTTGTLVTLSGITGFAAANGTFTITVTAPNKFTLNGTTAAGAGTGGTWSVPGDVLRNEFLTTPATLLTFAGTISDLDLTAFAGQTIRLRIASANNQGRLIVGVDNVTLTVQFADDTKPTLTGLGVSNPAYVTAIATGSIATAAGTAGNPIVITTTAAHGLATGNLVVVNGVANFGAANGTYLVTVLSPTTFSLDGTKTAGNGTGGTWTVGIPHTNDPTIVGAINDNSGLAGVAFVEFDPKNNGFGGADDFKITNWDGAGNFRFALTNPPAGLDTIGVRVVDKAGNVTQTTFTFFMQSNSVTEWEAVGPQGINTTDPNLRVDYTSVSGRVTVVLPDASDKLGNSYFIGSVNGGIWKTTDGGSHWVSVTNNITDDTVSPPAPVPVAVAGIGQSISNPQILYAATGVPDRELDSRPGVGILKSVDGGNTWTLAGNSNVVLAGARTGKVVVDPQDPNIAYVAVASGGTGGVDQNGVVGPAGPGVYKTTNGGLHWRNVLDPASMHYLTTAGNINTDTTLGAGAAIDSVTDLIIDPADRTRLFIGLGSIGLVPAAGTTGVWYSPQSSGAGWRLAQGGVNGGGFVLPNEPQQGTRLGRVTVGIGNGRTGNQGYVYALMGTPPGNNTPPNVNFGTFQGLYRTKDNMLNFTKVMLKENIIPAGPGAVHNFRNINLMGNDAANAGAIIVDPNNPNVVYVGGSSRWDPNSANGPKHILIRVDTGNMNETTGDDSSKQTAAAAQGNVYDPAPGSGSDAYVGEGVYWYDLVQDRSSRTGQLNSLPPAITSLAVDAQGRLLVGTIGGIWRGVGYGFGYDFTSGGRGILAGGGPGGGNNFSAPAMDFTSINANLQIATMTSVAIDPFNRGVYYTTQNATGVAGSSAPLVWASQGLTGPTVNGINLGIPNAGSVLSANPPPGSTLGTPVSLFRIWQYANALALQPETSSDSGATWNSIDSTGIFPNSPAGIFPAFAINPTPLATVDPGSGQVIYQTGLAFGADLVYTTNTSATTWDPISPVLSAGQTISAIAFAPSDVTGQTLYAATTDGKLFNTANKGGDNWPARFTGLPTGVAGSFIKGIAVDPNDANVVFVMYTGSPGTANHVWRSTDAGVTWTNISATLPKVSAYTMVIDRTAGLGAPTGKLYLATEVGVYYSTDDGNTWAKLGQGMPNVPVVDLKFDGNHATGSIAGASGLGGANPVVITTTAAHGIVTGTQVSITNVSGFAAANGTFTITVIDATRFSLDGNFNAGTGTGGTWTVPGLNVLAAATLGRGVYTINTSAFSFIADQIVDQNTPSNVIPFTVNNPTGATFTITATSDNQFLVANSGISLDGTGSNTVTGTGVNRTIQFTPVLNANTLNNGVANIAVTITSGAFSYQQKFQVTVNFINQVPIITAIPVQTINRRLVGSDPGTPVLNFTIGDVETPAAALTVTATSNNPTLIPNAAVITGATEVGTTATITTSAAHGYSIGQQVNVSGVSVNGYNGTFTITGVTATTFTYTTTSGLGPGTGGSASAFLLLGGTGPNRTIVVTPALNQVGSADITITVTDANLASNSTTFTVLVTMPVTLPFSDDFNRADSTIFLGPGWTQNVGTFNLQGAKASAAAGQDIVSLNQLSAADLALQTDVSVPVGQNLGLIARYNGGTSNFYWGSIINYGGATGVTADIWKNVGGTWTQLASTPVNGVGGIGTLRFEVAGDSLKLFYGPLAGTPALVAFANDRALAGPGSAGMRTSTGNVTADNFSATAINLTTPTLPFTDLFNGAAGSQLSVNWVNRGGNFAGNGAAMVANVGPASSLATVHGLNQTNGYAQAEVNVVGAGSYAGVVARYGNTGFYNALIINTGSGFIADIFRMNTNPVTGAITSVVQLTSDAPVGLGAGTVRLEVVGSSLKMFYGPTGSSPTTLVNVGYDNVLASGATGFRAFRGIAVDNFTTGDITLKNPTGYPFTDDFSTAVNADQLFGNAGQLVAPNERNWQDQGGDFLVSAGKASSGVGVSFATVAGSLGDSSAQADVVIDPAANQHAGVVLRSGPAGMYYGQILSTGSGFVAKILKLDAAGNLLAQLNAVNTVVAGMGTLRLEAAGPSLKLFLDNTLVAHGFDTQFATGLAGMRASKGTTTSLDNFTVNTITLTSPAAPPPAFVDDFSTANNGNQPSLNWTERAGNFTVGSGQLFSNDAGMNIMTLNGVSFADESAQIDVLAGAANQNVSLVLRYQANGAYYTGGIVQSGANFIPYMVRQTGTTFVNLAAVTNVTGVPIASTGTLRFEIAGNSLKLFWNGALVAYGYDFALTAPGLTGLRVSQGLALDNFAADAILLTTPTLPVADNFNTPVNGNQLYGDTTQLTITEQRNWDERAGNFVIASNMLTANDPNVASLATITGAAMQHAAVQADVALSAANQFAGLVARYQAGNYYTAVLRANSGLTASTATLFRVVGGATTQIGASVVIPATTGLLRLEVIGSELKLYFNNALVTYGYDAVLPNAGLSGVRASNGGTLDNFTANAITLMTPTPAVHAFADDFSTAVFGNQLYGDASQLNGNDQRHWVEQLGNFAITSGQAVAQDTTFNIATVNGVSLTDATVQADVVLGGNQYGSVVARYQVASGKFYVGVIQANAAGDAITPSIWTNASGTFTQLSGGPAIPIGIGSSNTIRFEVAGTAFRLFVNNALATYAYDASITAAGFTGIRGNKDAAFDNFFVDPITLLNPGLPFSDAFNSAANTPLSRNWTERQGLLSHTGTALQSTGAAVGIATVNNAVLNSSVQMDVDIPVIGTHNTGLVSRFDPATGNTYVGTLFTTNGSTTAYLFKRIGGSFTILNSKVIAATGQGTIKLDIVGNSIKFFYRPNAGTFALATYAIDASLPSAGLSGVYLGPTDTATNFNLSALTPTTPGLPFTDPFTGADGTQLSLNWVERSGNFSVAGNKLVANGNGFNLATVNGISVGAVQADADITVGAGQHGGVMVRYQANNSYYMGIVVSNSPSPGFTAYIFRVDNGTTFTQLAAVPVASGTGTLTLEAIGANLKLFYGANAGTQVLIANAYDTFYATGSAGIRSSMGVTFANFKTTQVNVPVAQPTPFTETFAASPPRQQLSTNWTQRAGSFTVLGGPATGTAGAVTSVNGGANIAALNGFSVATVNGISAANANLTGTINLAAAGQVAGFIARYTGNPGSDSYYAATVEFVGTNNYKLEIAKVINGTKTVLATANVAAFNGVLNFQVFNNNLFIYLDNSNLAALTVADGSITAAGGVGMRVNAGAKVNNFTSN